jgi:hypothetical protein
MKREKNSDVEAQRERYIEFPIVKISTWMHQTHKQSTNFLIFQNQTPSILQAMLWKESDVIT